MTSKDFQEVKVFIRARRINDYYKDEIPYSGSDEAMDGSGQRLSTHVDVT